MNVVLIQRRMYIYTHTKTHTHTHIYIYSSIHVCLKPVSALCVCNIELGSRSACIMQSCVEKGERQVSKRVVDYAKNITRKEEKRVSAYENKLANLLYYIRQRSLRRRIRVKKNSDVTCQQPVSSISLHICIHSILYVDTLKCVYIYIYAHSTVTSALMSRYHYESHSNNVYDSMRNSSIGDWSPACVRSITQYHIWP